MNNSFLSTEELSKLSFKSVGSNVFVSRYAKFYGVEQIIIGNNVRIDDFCILSDVYKRQIVALAGWLFPLASFPKLIVQVLLGGILVFGLSELFKLKDYLYLKDMVRTNIKTVYNE